MDEHLQDLYELGKKLFEEGKYSEAEPILREVISQKVRRAAEDSLFEKTNGSGGSRGGYGTSSRRQDPIQTM